MHYDIDHAFSWASGRLKSQDTTALNYFYGVLRDTYGGNVWATHMKSAINRSELGEKEKGLNPASFSQF